MLPATKRTIGVQLTREQRRLVSQEITRLRQEHDINLTPSEFIQVLIEAHRLRLKTLASEGSDAVSWMHTMLNDA